MAFVHQLAAFLFVISLPIALITTNVRITVNEPRLYEYAADHYDTPTTTGISRDELLSASAELRDYFNSGSGDPIFVRVEKEGEPISLFNRRETAHLQDVKTLIRSSFRVQEAAVIYALAYVVAVFIWAREGNLRALATQLVLTGLLGLAVIGVVGGMALTGFEQAFDAFHRIAFDNDLWQLDPATDHLIQMFPEGFWRDVSLWVGMATVAELAVLSVAAAAYMGMTRRQPAAYAQPDAAQA